MSETVVITGASAGVGRATAHAFAARGASVALLARGEEGLAGAAREVEERGGRALVVPCDVGDATAVDAAAARVEAELGPIDAWVNNAMVGALSEFADMEADEFERITQTTYLGVVNGTRAALRAMVPRDRGTVVQVGSALAYRGIPLQSAYCGAKHAIQGFTESVRSELLHQGSHVHLTMVQLPALNTPQFGLVRNRLPRHPQPVPPIFQPEVAARAIAWSARHRLRELWVGGNTAVVLVGNAIAPGIGDRYLARTGYDGQQSEMPPSGRDYLFAPVPGDHGTHGAFDAEAKDRSRFTEAAMAFGTVADAAGGVLGGALALVGAPRWAGARRRG